ncbi:reverse transcriptase domain-containing protein [Tanacetum coccineum]
MSPSAEEVGGYSSDGSSRSRSQERPRTALKHRKNVSKKKGTSKSHMSVRSEAQSRSKSKSVKSKPQSVGASRWKSSSDSGYDTVSNSGSEDLNMPYKWPKPMPFTSRITRFRYHRRAKLPPNVWVYKGNKDPEDHLSIFFAAVEQEELPMPVWCKMFRQTLSGLARNWFDSLDPKSVDRFEKLSINFLKEFSQQKRYDKDPTEIHGIKRKPNKGLQAFMDRFKAESTHIKGVPLVLRISAFMHGHGYLELSKKLNDKVPKTVDEMWERVRAFIRGEAAADTIEAIRSPRWEKSAGKAGWSEHQNGSRNRTIHSMMKFLTSNRIATISTTRETLRECRQIEEAQDLSRHARVTDPTPMQTSSEVANTRLSLAPVETRPRRPGKEPMQLDGTEGKRQLDKGRRLPKSSVEEKIVINDNYPKQLVTIGGGLSTECRHALIHTL